LGSAGAEADAGEDVVVGDAADDPCDVSGDPVEGDGGWVPPSRLRSG
jgi:hypothetical protein